jgi:Fe2+ or Zn2+ uptake regulation protein
VASRVNEIVGRLRERGHRLTPQRYAVVRALVEGGEHPSAEQLFHRVSDAYPMTSRATVYKTLDTLNAAGEVLESSSEPHIMHWRNAIIQSDSPVINKKLPPE